MKVQKFLAASAIVVAAAIPSASFAISDDLADLFNMDDSALVMDTNSAPTVTAEPQVIGETLLPAAGDLDLSQVAPDTSDEFFFDEACDEVIETGEALWVMPNAPMCNDGIDNDGDGFVDMDDPCCQMTNGESEYCEIPVVEASHEAAPVTLPKSGPATLAILGASALGVGIVRRVRK